MLDQNIQCIGGRSTRKQRDMSPLAVNCPYKGILFHSKSVSFQLPCLHSLISIRNLWKDHYQF